MFIYAPDVVERVLIDTLDPEFSGREPYNLFKRWLFRFRRWKTHEWKHKICYEDSLASIFMRAVWSHMLKPQTI